VRTIDTVGTKQLARLGPGQQFETIVRTDRGEFGPTGNRELVLCDPDGYEPRILEKK
jgi:hypothetical protein